MTVPPPVWLTDHLTRDIARAIRYTQLWGLEGVVLRFVDGGARVPDVNEAKVRNRLRTADLELAAIDPGLFDGPPGGRAEWLNDVVRLGECTAFCRRMACTRIISGALPGEPVDLAREAFRLAAARLEGSGLRLCVRNEGEGRVASAELSSFLQTVGSGEIASCWDPAEALAQRGEPPEEGLSALMGRVGVVVARDIRRASGQWAPCEFGGGEVGWRALVAMLIEGGYDGPICLDLSGATPQQALRAATALLHMIRDACQDVAR